MRTAQQAAHLPCGHGVRSIVDVLLLLAYRFLEDFTSGDGSAARGILYGRWGFLLGPRRKNLGFEGRTESPPDN